MNGDEVRLTGETESHAGRVWLVCVFVEGRRAGERVLMIRPEDKAADSARARALDAELQAGFRRLAARVDGGAL
jgi:hypothetical protein